MVLTNFESCAHGGSQPNNDNIGAVGGNRRNHDLFNLNAICHADAGSNLIQCNNSNNYEYHQEQVQTQEQQQIQTLPIKNSETINISLISSNGYYGFSQICSQQNNENAKKSAMEEDNMMDVEQVLNYCGGSTRKRLHESNNYDAKRCRFDANNDSQLDDFCQTSFAPNALTDCAIDHPNLQQNINQQQPIVQKSFIINNNNNQSELSSTKTIYKSNNLQNSSTITTNSTNTYSDMSRCMSSHMI